MIKYFFSAILLVSVFATGFAQASAPKTNADAKKLLDKTRKTYDGYKALEVNFALTIEVAEQPKEVQKGKIAQEGNSFLLEMTSQTIISDTKTTWVYQKKINEVQISDADPNDDKGFITPKELLRRYDKGDYTYDLLDVITENGKVLAQIEFKPVDKKSEYAKIRVSINKKTNLIDSIKAFSKDGSRYTFAITRHKPQASFPAGYFSFDKSKYPGVKVEDLRM